MLSDAELLTIEFQTAFVLERPGRILITNDPDRSPAPRFALSGCTSGNIYGVRDHVGVISNFAAAQSLPMSFQGEPPRPIIARHSNGFARVLRTRTNAHRSRARMQAA